MRHRTALPRLVLLACACAHGPPPYTGPVQGHYAFATLERTMGSLRTSIASCVSTRQTGSTNTLFAGDLFVEFILDPEGHVRNLVVVHETVPLVVEDCALELLQNTRFPPPVGGAIGVYYPLTWRLREVHQAFQASAPPEPRLFHQRATNAPPKPYLRPYR